MRGNIIPKEYHNDVDRPFEPKTVSAVEREAPKPNEAKWLGTRTRAWEEFSRSLRHVVRICRELLSSEVVVPPHLQSIFDRARVQAVNSRLPLYFAIQIISALVGVGALWGRCSLLSAFMLAVISVAALLWRLMMVPRIRNLLHEQEGVLSQPVPEAHDRSQKRSDRLVEKGRPEHDSRENFSFVWKTIRCFNVVLGVAWASFVTILLLRPENSMRLYGLLVVMVLLMSILTTSKVRYAIELMIAPLFGGVCIGLIATWHGSIFGHIALLMELGLAAVSAIALGRLTCRLNSQLFLITLEQKEQAEIVRLLMRHSDTQLGDWLWRTDAEGRVQNPSPRFAGMLGLTFDEIQGKNLITLLGLPAPVLKPASPAERLSTSLAARQTFRDICIPVNRGSVKRWWNMTGRPVFLDGVFLGHRGVGADVTDRHDASILLSHHVRHDGITGLPNRLGFSERMHGALIALTGESKPFGLLLIGVRQDKLTVTPDQGDMTEPVMAAMAARLQRIADGHHEVCRYSKNEFLILCSGRQGDQTTLPLARKVSQKVLEASSEPFPFQGKILLFDVRIGIALAPEAGVRISQLVDAAADALEEAQNGPYGPVRFYDHDALSRAVSYEALLAAVRAAVRDQAFRLFYQPIIDTRTLQVCGAEALSRWDGVAAGRVSIERIISIIEADNLGEAFDLWVLETACRTACEWPDNLWVSVNMLASHFANSSVPKAVSRILDRTGLSASRLQIEITETLFLEPRAEVFSTLGALDALGIHIVVDDFGKGFSSLGYLRLFPFSKIKLDASFVQEMLQDARSAAVVRSVLELAVDLGITVVAEGVATQEQYHYLLERGCPEVQGYLFASPLSESDFAEYLRENRRSLAIS